MSRAAALRGQMRIALRGGPVRGLAGLTAAGFALTAALPPAFHLSTICGRIPLADLPGLASARLIFPSLAGLALGWLAMTLAMMPLLVAGPLAHVRRCSLPRRRLRAMLWFALGYGSCWALAGAALAPAALLLAVVLAPGPAAGLSLAVAVAWSASPVAQMARNRCHRTLRIGAFGLAADRDCLRQGIATGVACVGTCWPWMLLPALAGKAHLAVMAAVAVLLLADRLAPAGPVRWRVPSALEVLLGPRLTGCSAPQPGGPGRR